MPPKTKTPTPAPARETTTKTKTKTKGTGRKKTGTSAPEAGPSTSATTPTFAPSGPTTMAPPPPPSNMSEIEEPSVKPARKKKTKTPSTPTSESSASVKTATTAPKKPRARKPKALSRGRVPTLPAAILRARAHDKKLRVKPGESGPSEDVQNDPNLLPWVPQLLEALELPPLGMLDDEFKDVRGNHPTDAEKKEFRQFFDQVKQDPEICSRLALKDIPGSGAFRLWAYKTWSPKLGALVRAELVKSGDSWTQRQMKSERNHVVDLGATAIASDRKKEILEALFGEAAFNDDKHRGVIAGIDVVVKDLVYRVSDQERKRYRTLQPLLETARQTIKEAIITMDNPTKVDVAQFKEAVTKANQLRKIFAQVGIEPEDDDETLLEDFMGASMKVVAAKEAQLKTSGGTTDRMVWNQAQIAEAQDVYAAHFLTSEAMIDIVQDEVLTEAVFGKIDIGVDLVRALDKPALYQRLGILANGHIPHMKPFEAICDHLPGGGPDRLWDFAALREWAISSLPTEEQNTPATMLRPVPPQRDILPEEKMERECPRTHQLIRCHLHQVQGIMAIAEQAFKPTEDGVHVSTMLADSMGLGKTLTAIGYALMVAHWYQIQHAEGGRPMPEHFAERFWCGLKEIPNAAIIIIVPNNLLTQWVSELRSFVQPALVDILVFDPRGKGAAELWWVEQWEKSEIEPHRRIIVTTSNAVKREADRVLKPAAHGRAGYCFPGDRRTPLKDHAIDLFSVKSSVLILDEIHDYRNLNRDAHGVLTISSNAHHTLGLTGTPVYNATTDLLAQGCVLGIPEFVAENFISKKAEITKLMPKRRGKATLVEGENILTAVISAQKRLVDDNAKPIEMMKEWFQPYLIRRTMDSLDPYGNRILPPIHNTVSKSYVKLSQEEEEQTNKMCDVQNTAWGGTSKVFNSQNFYTEYRLCLQWPGHSRVKAENLRTIAASKDWDTNEFDARLPSKMMRVVEILDYHIPESLRQPSEATADVPVEERVRTALKWHFQTGARVPPQSQEDLAAAWKAQQALLTEPSPSEPPPDIALVGGLRRTKVIITLTYTMYLPILVRLLKIRGYKVRTFTGDTPIGDRGKIIEEFNQDNAHLADGNDGYSFILIMSGIGITGLNCTRGAIMIHFDQAWSQQEENQATHRIVRLGQIEHCIIYKVLALGTTDIWMNQIASGKELMLDLFSGHDSLALQALKNPSLIAAHADDEDDNGADLDDPMKFDPKTALPPSDDENDHDQPVPDDLRPSIPYRDKGKQRAGAPPIPPSVLRGESPSSHLHLGGMLQNLPGLQAGETVPESMDLDAPNPAQEPQNDVEPPGQSGGKRAATSPEPSGQPVMKRGPGYRGKPVTTTSRMTRSQGPAADHPGPSAAASNPASQPADNIDDKNNDGDESNSTSDDDDDERPTATVFELKNLRAGRTAGVNR